MTLPSKLASRTIEELRSEFTSNGLRGWLWEWLLAVLGAYVWLRLAGRYKPALYSPSGRWDREGAHDLINEFLVERGIRKGVVSQALMVTDSTSACIAYLERSFHRFVISQGGQSVSRNIYTRLVDILVEDPHLRRLAGAGATSAYGDESWSENPPLVADENTLREAEKFLPAHVETIHYRSEKRRSPVFGKETLSTIARALIRGTGRLLTASQILRVISSRFTLAEGPGTPVANGDDTLLQLASSQLDPLEELIAEETATRLLITMTDRQREVFYLWTQEDPPLTVREIAEQAGLGKSTVHNEQKAITVLAEGLKLTSRAEQDQVLSICARILRERAVSASASEGD